MSSAGLIGHGRTPNIVVRDNSYDAANAPGGVYAGQKLPTDAIGTHTLTLLNVVVGSRVHIETQDGATVLYDDVAAGSTVTPAAFDVYAGGSAKNDWRIRVRKGSSGTTYRPYETLTTVSVGAQSIYVSQIQDE